MIDRPTGWGGDPVAQPTLENIRTAAERIADYIVHTPLVPLHSYEAKANIFLKPEILQPIGSFKLRGVLNWAAALSPEQRAKGLSTTSSGNTAQALGYAGRIFDVPTRTLVPDTIPQNKLHAITAYGVEPIKKPFPELLAYMLEEGWRTEPYSYLNPWGDPHLLAGHGSLGLEIVEALPNVKNVYIPVGGGGLIAGVGSALKLLSADIRVIAAQTANCPALKASFDRRKGGWIESQPTICEGTAVPIIVDEMYPILRSVIDDVITISDDAVKEAIRRLALNNKLVVEGSGALSLAAALSAPETERGLSVCILSGGSIDSEKLSQILTA